MKEQINQIQETLNEVKVLPTLTVKDFDQLPLDAQVALSYSIASSAGNSVVYWNRQLEKATNPTNDDIIELRKEGREWSEPTATQLEFLGNEIATATALHRSICGFLESKSKITEAVSELTTSDLGSYNAVEGRLENDEMEVALTAMKGHPHAWAKASLIKRDRWADKLEKKLAISQEAFTRAVENNTAQLFGRWMVQLRLGMDIGSRRDALDIIILQCDARMLLLNTETELSTFKQMYNFIKSQKGKVFLGNSSYNFASVIGPYFDMRDQLEDEVTEAEIRSMTREIKHQMRARSFMHNTFELIKEQIKQLKNPTPEDIRDLVEPFEDKLTAKQYKELVTV